MFTFMENSWKRTFTNTWHRICAPKWNLSEMPIPIGHVDLHGNRKEDHYAKQTRRNQNLHHIFNPKLVSPCTTHSHTRVHERAKSNCGLHSGGRPKHFRLRGEAAQWHRPSTSHAHVEGLVGGASCRVAR